MPDIALRLLDSVLLVFLIGLAGFVAERRGLFGERGRAALSAVMLHIAYPALGFYSMATGIDPAAATENVTAVLLGVLTLVVGCAFGYIAVWPTRLEGARRRTFVHLLTTNNFINLPLPIVLALWPGSVDTLFLMLLGSGTLYWVIGIFPLVRHLHPLQQLRNVVNLPFAGLLGGLVVGAMGWGEVMQETPVLRTLLETCRVTGAAMVPVAILFIGASLAAATARSSRGLMIYYSVCRLIVFPLLFLPIICWAGLPMEASYVVLLVAMMPASNTSAMIADRFGGDAELASAANLYSTPLALLTVPLLFPVFSQLLC